MKRTFKTKTKTSKIIALLIVFAMLLAPFCEHAGLKNATKAEEVSLHEKTADISVTGCTVESNVTKPTFTACDYTWKLASGYQKAKFTFGVNNPGTDKIGYDADGDPVYASYKYMYKDYTDALPADPAPESELSVDTGLTSFDSPITIEENKKYAIYAYVENWNDADYDADGNSKELIGTKYVLVSKIEVTFVTGIDLTVSDDKIHLEWNGDKWSGTDNKIVSNAYNVEIAGRPTQTGNQFSIKYAFVEKDVEPVDTNFSDSEYTCNSVGAYDAYVAIFDKTGDVCTQLKKVKVGTVVIADKDKKTISFAWTGETENVAIAGAKKEAQSVTATSITYDKIVSAKVTYTKDGVVTELDSSSFTYTSNRNEDGYYKNVFSFTMPKDIDKNVQVGAIKVELFKEGDTDSALVSSDLGAFLFDKTKPIVEWNGYITPGDTWYRVYSDNTWISVNIKDNDQDAAYVAGNESSIVTKKYKIGDGTQSEINGGFNVPKSSDSNGTKVTLDIVDAAGNSIDVKEYYFKLDGTAPQNVAVNVRGNAVADKVWAKKTDVLAVNADDYESGLGKIEYIVNGTIKKTLDSFDNQDSNITIESILGADCADGTYNVEVKVYDKVGNNTSKQFTVYYDNVKPEFTVALGYAPGTDTDWSRWTEVDSTLITDGIFKIKSDDTTNKYAYKLVVTDTYLDTNVANTIHELVTNEIITSPGVSDTYSSGNVYYFEINKSKLSASEAKVPAIIIKDKAGNLSSSEAAFFAPKIQAVNLNLNLDVKIYSHGTLVTPGATDLIVTNDYKAVITATSPNKFASVVARYNTTDLLSSTNEEGTFIPTEGVYSVELTVELPYSYATDLTELFNGITIEAKNQLYDESDGKTYKTITLNNVLYDKSNPTDSVTTPSVDWVQNVSFTAYITSGNGTNESEIESASYSIAGAADTLMVVDATDRKKTETVSGITIPESTSTSGTTVILKAQDVAGNYLNGSADGKTYTYFVDATAPEIVSISAMENQTYNPLTGIPVITSSIKDNLTLHHLEVTVVGTASKTTTFDYDMDVNGAAREFRKSLNTLVADEDKTETGIKDGSYTVSIKAFDKAGNSRADSITFVVDNTTPVVSAAISAGTINTVQSPKNATYYNGNVTLDLGYTEKNIKNVVVKDNGTEVAVSWNGTNATYTSTTEGQHTVTIVATDKSGHTSEEKSVLFVIDKTKPVVSATVNGISNPASNLDLSTNATVNAAITDNSPTELYYQTTIAKPDMTAVTTEYMLVGTKSFSFTEEGDYTINFYSVDAANNKSEVRSVSFRIDKTAPALTITGANGEKSAQPATVSFRMEEAFWQNASGTVKVYRKTGDGQPEYLLKTVQVRPTARVTTISENLTESGKYRFEFDAEDRMGHTANSISEILIDVSKPQVTMSGVENYDLIDSSVSFESTIRDNFYNSMNISFVGTVTDMDGKTSSIDHTVEGLTPAVISNLFEEDGIYDITVSVTDEVGNTDSKSVHFTIDKTAPVIDDLSEYDGKYLQKFVWNKDIEEMVHDLTVCDVKMLLNGKEYDGTSDLEDGSYVLVITAEDELGHKTETAPVGFVIDTVNPMIIVTGVEDNEVKNENYNISISLQLDEDILSSVTLNGKKIDIVNDQADFTVSSKGDYELVIEAVDVAGNTSTQTITFTYGREKKDLLFVIIGSVAAAAAIGGGIFFALLKKKFK